MSTFARASIGVADRRRLDPLEGLLDNPDRFGKVLRMDKFERLLAADLRIGTTFSTLYEGKCTVTSLPDSDGNFRALDSDGVECEFHVSMIVNINR